MKKYIQPEVELIKLTSEPVSIMSGEGSAVSNTIDEGDIVIP